MRVLMLGSDRTMFDPESRATRRARKYAEALGGLTLIVAARRALHCAPIDEQLLDIIPTNSLFRALYGWDMLRIAKRLPLPDVISSQGPFEFGLVGLLLSRSLKKPLYVQVHTDLFDPNFNRAHWPLNVIRKSLAGFVLRRANRIRVVSQHLKKNIAEHYCVKAPISVLPISVNIERFRSAQASPDLVNRFAEYELKFLIVSRLESEKNIDLALSSFAALESRGCLIILGEGKDAERLRARARQLGIAPRVFFEGRKDPTEYYALCDALLVTSMYEGYGLSIVEALAAGKPVISTDVGIAREAGALVARPEEYASTLRTWCDSGSRSGILSGYPYRDFEDYVRQYAADIKATS